MSKFEYKIRDMENGDIIYKGSNPMKATLAYYEYDKGCEGDWWPRITINGRPITLNGISEYFFRLYKETEEETVNE